MTPNTYILEILCDNYHALSFDELRKDYSLKRKPLRKALATLMRLGLIYRLRGHDRAYLATERGYRAYEYIFKKKPNAHWDIPF